MSISVLLCLMFLQPSAPPDLDTRIAELAASGGAHHDAGEFGSAATDYLKLALLPGADGETALKQAHLNLDAASVKTGEVAYLCRALAVARGRLAAGKFKSEQAQLSWAEIAADDEKRLAAAGGQESCPPAVVASRPPRLLDADTPVRPERTREEPTKPDPIQVRSAAPDPLVRVAERKFRVRTVAGAAFTGIGLGLAGMTGLTLALQHQQVAALRQASDVPEGYIYRPSEEKALRDLYHGAELTRAASIGLGVVSAVVLGTGIGLLASRRRAPHGLALTPHGGLHGGGLTLRLRF